MGDLGTLSLVLSCGVLHELKTTGTRLVWRTRPCGTEGMRHLKNSSFQYLTTSIQVWVTNQLPLPSLMWKKNQLFKTFFNFRGGQNRQGCGSSCPARHLWNSFNIKVLQICLDWVSSWYSFVQDLESFLTPKLRLGPCSWWSFMLWQVVNWSASLVW